MFPELVLMIFFLINVNSSLTSLFYTLGAILFAFRLLLYCISSVIVGIYFDFSSSSSEPVMLSELSYYFGCIKLKGEESLLLEIKVKCEPYLTGTYAFITG